MKFIRLNSDSTHAQEKMAFFAENYLFINNFLGVLPMLPFETPASLISKIIYQIKYNEIDKSLQYLDIYIPSLINHFSNLMNKEEEPFKELLNTFFLPYMNNTQPVKKKEKQRKLKLISDNPNLISTLSILETVINGSLLENTIESLYGLISCDKPEHNHFNDISQYTQLLVAILRLENYSKKYLENILGRILSQDTEQFPFPDEIIKLKKDRAAYNEARLQFTENRDFKKQLEGFKNVLKAHLLQKGIFIFPIENVHFEEKVYETFNVKFNEVRFVSSSNLMFQTIRDSLFARATKAGIMESFDIFFNGNRILGITELNFEHPRSSKLLAYNTIKRELIEFNNYLGTDCSVHWEHYLFSEDMNSAKYAYSATIPSSVLLTNLDIESVHQNVYTVLSDLDSESASQLRRNETIFSRAWNENEPSQFWQYLENIFWFENREIRREVERNYVKLSLNSNSVVLKELARSIGDLFNTWETQGILTDLGISEDERAFLYNELFKNTNYNLDFSTIKSKIKRPFVNLLFSILEEIRTESYKKKWESHYNALVYELKDYRNAYLHAGIINSASKIKLQEIIPSLINRIRWHLVHKCVDTPGIEYEKFLNLVLNGK